MVERFPEVYLASCRALPAISLRVVLESDNEFFG